ncbi:MAG: diguanylate cyclase [Clostridia bacterium]|nr:diguanylate cyclase [Clostridia bacterium]
MSYFITKHFPFKMDVKSLISNHFTSRFKKIELTLCIVFYLLLFAAQRIIQLDSVNGVIAQVHAFISLYLAIRFRYLGLLVGLLLSLNDIVVVSVLYFITQNPNMIIAFTQKIITVLTIVAIAVLSNREEMRKRELQRLSITDELTKVYNRRHFHSVLDHEFSKANSSSAIGLIFIDIANFKLFNDNLGHESGDVILKATADLLSDLVREEHPVFRYGGHKFAILLIGAEKEAVEAAAKKIKEEFETLKGNYYPQWLTNNIALSMGLSQYPNIAHCKDELISQADMALYHAKNLGADNIHFYRDIMLQLRKSISADHQQLIGIFKALLSSLSAKDTYTLGHSERVSSFAVRIGERIGLSPREVSILQYAGLLHDIGKIEIPKSILNKVDRLTEQEFGLIKMHPIYSANILEPLGSMDELIEYVRHHHERFDGKGYPDGLQGNAISLGARILCVADSYDAMISERPYRGRMTPEAAMAELIRCAGTQFDPDIVDIFIDTLKVKIA